MSRMNNRAFIISILSGCLIFTGFYLVLLPAPAGAQTGQGRLSKMLSRLAVLPKVSFTYDPSFPAVGQSVQFSDTTGGNPVSWVWDFGDGTGSSVRNPSHAYGKSGFYKITLIVGNSNGSRRASRTIMVLGTTSAKSVLSPSFSYTPSAPLAGQEVKFTDTSTGNPTSWHWNFGDTATSRERNPSHTFLAGGSYGVTFTVSNGSETKSVTKTVTVTSGLAADFKYSPSSPVSDQAIQFTDMSTGNPTSWLWNFGDGSTSSARHPSHSYEEAGKYFVNLNISDGSGSANTSKSIYVLSSSTDIHYASDLTLTEIQAMVDAAKPGDTVILPAGTVTWDYKLIIRKGIILKGAGIDKTVIVNNYGGAAGDYDPCMILYKPDDFEANQALRITGITFDINNTGHGILLAHHRSSSLTIQTRIRIDHNKFKNATDRHPSHQAIIDNGMRGVVDNNIFEDMVYPIRNQASADNGKSWWDNWEAVVYGKADNNIYYEDNVFTGVIIVMDSQYANRYVFRYNTVYATENAYPLLDSHGNYDKVIMYSSFGGEIYGNLFYGPDNWGVDLLDDRGGKFLVFMNAIVASPVNYSFIQIRDESPDSATPTTNPSPQYPNDTYYFLNRENYTGGTPDIVEGQHSDNPPDHMHCPTPDRDYFNGRDDFDGSSGVGYGPLSSRPEPKLVGVGYWATDQNIANLEGMVGKNPATPISGTLYKCTAPGVWTAYYKPYTYPHPLRTILGD